MATEGKAQGLDLATINLGFHTKKGRLILDDVGYEKKKLLKDTFAKGANPKTMTAQKAPTAKVAPKLGNNFSEEVVIGDKEMQVWNDPETKHIVDHILR